MITKQLIVPFIMLLTASGAASAQDEAMAALEKAGAKITRDDMAPEKPVIAVNLGVTQADDAALESLKGLDKLQKLTLNGTKITDAGLDHVKGLATLQKLYLVDTNVTDAGLEKLKALKELKILSLAGTKVTDAGMTHLSGLSTLETVFLHGTMVTDEGAKVIKDAIPKVKVEM